MESDPSKEKTKPTFFERLTGGKREPASEDELREIVDVAVDLAESEKRMIHDIIDLGDTTADEICTPRVDVMLVDDDETGRVALDRMRGTGYSRLPVCHDGIDDIIGIVHYKDLIGPLMDGSIDQSVTEFMYEPMFVPETKDVIPLLGEMQAAHQQMAIVVDEYGGTEGVVTVEDILEEIVGEIADESDLDGDLVTLVSPGIWKADGRLPVADAVELGWPVIESDDYDTLAGWLMNKMESYPEVGDTLSVDGFEFTIERMRRSRISTVRVEGPTA
ncbi:MAG: HlyC/CorC family transporter [Eggerthellaceae bacterium]|nr:HlyC/CorC family transporter [Eggerthellaceae bacterium]